MSPAYLTDTRYVRFLAGLPGLWGEVGALDDPAFRRTLEAERRALGLVDISARLPTRRTARRTRP